MAALYESVRNFLGKFDGEEAYYSMEVCKGSWNDSEASGFYVGQCDFKTASLSEKPWNFTPCRWFETQAEAIAWADKEAAKVIGPKAE